MFFMMGFYSKRYYLLVFLLPQLWLSVSASGKSDLLTPIPRWYESWAASQSRGTAIAMAVEDYIVVLLRSPSTNVYRSPLLSADGTELSGLRLERLEGEYHHTCMQYAPSCFPVGTHTICAVTGLALDVEHVCRVLLKKVADHLFVYQATMTTHAMTQKIASVLQEECFLKGSRPYGVQCMLVGYDNIDLKDGGICIFTIDPTGTWQSWGKATAIGKFGSDVREILARRLQSSPNITKLDEALTYLLWSCKETFSEIGLEKKDDQDFEVLILKKETKYDRKNLLYRIFSKEVYRSIADSAI